MERPTITDYIDKSKSFEEVHAMYIRALPLFNYANALDRYIDYLEDKLSENSPSGEGRALPPIEHTEEKCQCTYPKKSNRISNFCTHCRRHTY